MSLNGLDDAKVAEAYQGALAEAGGWFLLKYVSRDAVEVLTRGAGGAAEVRTAVAQYDEKSPLYGFLLYRRRKVLIKYIPDGTSRLLQARVAVHFTAVIEKFTPHDSCISITTADELSDTALSAACSLHTAAPSSCSSSGSSRRHKLDEITEDAEEGQTAADDDASQERPLTAVSSSIPIIVAPPDTTETRADEAPVSSDPPTVASTPGEDKAAAADDDDDDSQFEAKMHDYRENLKHYDSLFENGPDPRLSSQTARPALSEMYAEIYAQYNKPKVKLGPRPKQSLDVKRPHTSGTGIQTVSRPKSSLPAGLRVANRKPAEKSRPKSRDSSIVPSIAFPPPPPIPIVPDIPMSPMYPPKSPASVKSMPIPSYSSHHRSSGVTPEKQRLMKALELRKKQLKVKQEKKEKQAEDEPEVTQGPKEKMKRVAEPVVNEPSSSAPKEEDNTPAEPDSTTSNPAPDSALVSVPVQENKRDSSSAKVSSNSDDQKSPLNQEDSGVDLMTSHVETDDHHSAASACSPTSAQTQGSSGAPSTRPSSISEDDRQIVGDIEKIHENQTPTNDSFVQVPRNDDEQESIESSPTVVPEASTPVPMVEVSEQMTEPLAQPLALASALDDAPVKMSKRESMILMPRDMDNARSRKSKRESMIFMPSNESDQNESTSRRQKRESMIMPMARSQSPLDVKDSGLLAAEPLYLSAENSETEYLSDDSFMEELQSATVQQAKHVSVSKSPITPFFPRKSNASQLSIPERSPSQVYSKSVRNSPEQPVVRRVSGPWPPHANTDTVVMAKKINVSSGISQRIKALAEKSNRDSTASVSLVANPDASTSLVAQRKSSFFSTPLSTPSAGDSPNGKPAQRLSRASFAIPSASTAPVDKQTVSQPPPASTEQSSYTVKQDLQQPDSVQVTARIVRDVRYQKPALTMPTGNTPLELHQSPIIIDHKKSARPSSTRPSSSSQHSLLKNEPASPRPPSSSHSRDQSASTVPRTSSESSWRSFGRRLSESRAGATAPRSQSAHSVESTEERREEKKEKKDSRTSKLFKRMSNMSSISRKSQSTNTLQEEEMHTSLPSLREPPPAVQVGDLNIQFPDTLLWKRRWVEIDAMGNLVLSPSTSNQQAKGIIKRFHLSEMRTPYAPDQDRQELPNSVVLDFFDGRTLQCACESYVAQIQVLQILREAHDAWLAYNQGQ